MVRREEQYATLCANVVVELNSESHARKPITRAWAIIRRADRARRLAGQRTSRGDRRHADRTSRSDRTSRPHQPEERGWLGMGDDYSPRPARQRSAALPDRATPLYGNPILRRSPRLLCDAGSGQLSG